MPDCLPFEVEQFVRDRITGRVDNFRVARLKDHLVLQGRSRSFYAKQLAQEAARKFSPQTPLTNEICVVLD